MDSSNILPIAAVVVAAVIVVILLLRFMRMRQREARANENTPLAVDEEEYLDSSHIIHRTDPPDVARRNTKNKPRS